MSDLIDTTEMYLKSIMELLEEGMVPLRARIAERLGQSGPTVSQTVARMERDGLLLVLPDRRLELTDEGHRLGTQVMRKHRLVERLLLDVVGLDWHLIHDEACRWEHVVSDVVESRLVSLLGESARDPYGNVIPGLDDDGRVPQEAKGGAEGVSLTQIAQRLHQGTGPSVAVTVVRLGEILQADADLLRALAERRLRPGAQARASLDEDRVSVRLECADAEAGALVITPDEQRYFFVTELSASQ